MSTYVFALPSQRVGVGPQHQCSAGKGVERRNDFSWIDVPKRHDLIVGKPVIITVFGG